MIFAAEATAALALRGMVKLPTGDDAAGVSTGKADGTIDIVLSTETRAHVELAGFAGWEIRGQPAGVDVPGGAFRWGAGAGFPTRSPLRGTFEINGLIPSGDSLTFASPLVATDGSVAPLTSSVDPITRATAGLTWQNRPTGGT